VIWSHHRVPVISVLDCLQPSHQAVSTQQFRSGGSYSSPDMMTLTPAWTNIVATSTDNEWMIGHGWRSWCYADQLWVQLSSGPLQATSSKLLIYYMLRPTQPPILSRTACEIPLANQLSLSRLCSAAGHVAHISGIRTAVTIRDLSLLTSNV